MTSVTNLPHPPIGDVSLTGILFALSDPARLEIVRELAGGPLSMAECGVTNPDLPNIGGLGTSRCRAVSTRGRARTRS